MNINHFSCVKRMKKTNAITSDPLICLTYLPNINTLATSNAEI